MPVLDLFRLDGKVAVVTGASSGLGVGIARGLAEAGADVALVARRLDRLEATGELIRSATGRRVLTVQADVSSVEDCKAAVARIGDSFGRIDVLVNNAGVSGDYPKATEEDPEHFRSVVDVNLHGSYWMAKLVAPWMPPGGSMVMISSIAAVTTMKRPAAAYAASKAGVLGLCRDLAAQWADPEGIRVNAILPGLFATEATEDMTPEVKARVIRSRVPLKRMGELDDVAAATVFLASPASGYVTGSVLAVEGGLLLL